LTFLQHRRLTVYSRRVVEETSDSDDLPMISHAVAMRAALPRSDTRPLRAVGRSPLLELQRLAGNRAVTAALATLQRDEDDTAVGIASGADKAPPRRVTGYLGLNPLAHREAASLTKKSREEVLVSLNDPEAEKRLKENPAVFDFVVDELGIGLDNFARWDKATDVLLNADPHIRDQLADLMRWFASAERGEIELERLVLSGHSNGVELWGEAQANAESKPGTMVVDRDLATLAAVFPTATAQVQDIMFSACFSINAVELVIRIFPNLQTCWSYSKFSPDIAGGSGEHIAAWSGATEGAATLRKGQKRGTSALWTREKGYIVGDPSAAAVGPLYSDVVRGWRDVGQPMYRGERDVPKASLEPLYGKVQELLAHPGADDSQRGQAAHVRDVILRLRYWPLIRERFGAEYGSEVKPLFDALGMPVPEWASLTRVALRAHLEAILKALEGNPDAADAKRIFERYLKKGLFHLDPELIKSDWI
jgi:hypothetical protein